MTSRKHHISIVLSKTHTMSQTSTCPSRRGLWYCVYSPNFNRYKSQNVAQHPQQNPEQNEGSEEGKEAYFVKCFTKISSISLFFSGSLCTKKWIALTRDSGLPLSLKKEKKNCQRSTQNQIYSYKSTITTAHLFDIFKQTLT